MNNIDPALGGQGADSKATSSSSQLRYEKQPPQFPSASTPGSNTNASLSYPAQPSPQPYYNNSYPTPQNTNTPQQHQVSTGTSSLDGQSNLASPVDDATAAAYHALQQDAAADNSNSADEAGGQPGDDAKRPRACEACRGLKVRCDQDPNQPDLPCRRCAKAGRQCVITAPSRKRQKKADSRVAELEKKLDALTAVLQQQGGSHAQHFGSPLYASGAPPPAPPMHHSQQTGYPMHPPSMPDHSMAPPPPSDGKSHKRKAGEANLSETPHHGATSRHTQSSYSSNPDIARYLSRGSPEDFMTRINNLVTPENGTSIFGRYLNELSPHMPAVVFQPGTTAERIRKEKPILYACILSAGAHGVLDQDVCRELAREAVRAIADCAVCNGSKSLELIQAMQVLALWYKPPERAEQTNFYQIIHIAAVMAIDIGLGKRFNASKAKRGFGGPQAEYAPGQGNMLPQNSDTVEARRAWLGCYYLCASASMVLRRPNLVHWTKYMQECVDILETSSEALPSDKLFCQHIKIQHICEEVSVQFLMTDNSANISISDPKVSYTLNVLESDLQKWSSQIPDELKDHPGLKFFKHVANLYLHEIALHFNHNIEDFRLPFTEESLKSVNNSSEQFTQNQIAALEACRQSAHGMLDTMLAFDPKIIKALPMLIFFVRCTYAIVILIKMHVAVTTPGSEISKMMTAEDIKADEYMDGLMDLFSHVSNESVHRPHPKVLKILSMLKGWFVRHKENVAAQARGEQLPNPPTTSQQQTEQGNGDGPYNQTPLHMLSQVATANRQQQEQQQSSQSGAGDNNSWGFDSPFPVSYTARTHSNHPDSQFPIHQQAGNYAPQSESGTAAFGSIDQFDPSNAWLWGTNFQQAMNLNMATMDGISGGDVTGLFWGDGLAPFGALNGEFQ